MDRCDKQADIHTDNTGEQFPVHRNSSTTWAQQSNDYPKSHGSYKRNRYYKHFLAIISCGLLSPSAALSNTVGGVSATANPVANSSGSVTNQAIQVLQGPYITNTYGGGIQCQGPTLNFTPYVTGSVSAQKPFEGYYDDPVYNLSDQNEDGIPDSPGEVLYTMPTRTGQKDNYNLSVGFSATWSTPLDRKLQDQCKQAATANIELMQQTTANKRLDFEIARLKNCGELIQAGIMFHPKSPYFKICADVVVTNPGGVIPPHVHTISSPKPSSKQTEQQSPRADTADALGPTLELPRSHGTR